MAGADETPRKINVSLNPGVPFIPLIFPIPPFPTSDTGEGLD
jgi:hypothetical protein